MAAARLHAIISGRVQGVGFRYFAQHHGLSLGLRGWVRNLRGSQVEVAAEGEREALEQLAAVLREGPAGAHVTHAEVTWGEPRGEPAGFHVGPSG